MEKIIQISVLPIIEKRKISTGEHVAGIVALTELVKLLPNLKVAMLVGGKAQRAGPILKELGLEILHSAHPSPIVYATRPALWQSIADEWSQVRPFLSFEE